jgi:hypothetical protein
MAVNVKLLRDVQKDILRFPERFDMGTWNGQASEDKTLCGMTCCIGGWALVEKGFKVKKVRQVEATEDGKYVYYQPDFVRNGKHVRDTEAAAQKALRLDVDQKEALFYSYNWPAPFRELYDKAETPEAKAAIAAARIEAFIHEHAA